MAVQKEKHGKGIGTALLRSAFDSALKVKAEAACRLMIVDAYATAVTFYQQYGFLALSQRSDHRSPIRMFLDLNTLEDAKTNGGIISMPAIMPLKVSVLVAA
jgi:predicted GNAT family N-acyltransferase